MKLDPLNCSVQKSSSFLIFASIIILTSSVTAGDHIEYGEKVTAPSGAPISRIGPAMSPFGYGKMDAIWPHQQGQPTNIPVCWETLEPAHRKQRDLVSAELIDTWSDVAAIRFTGWQKCESGASGVHVQVSDAGPRALKLGRDLDAIEHGLSLNFTFGEWIPDPWCVKNDRNRAECIKAIAVHEFGHVLGLSHEQNREDTPGECQELPQGPDGTKELTPWDRSSVMNYCNKIYKVDGWKLSDGDKSSAIAMYGVRF